MSKLLLEIILSSEVYFEIIVVYFYESVNHSLRQRAYTPTGAGGRK